MELLKGLLSNLSLLDIYTCTLLSSRSQDSRCCCKCIIQLISSPRGPSISHTRPFLTLAGIFWPEGLLTVVLGCSSLYLVKKEGKDEHKAFLFLCRISEQFSCFLLSATAYERINVWELWERRNITGVLSTQQEQKLTVIDALLNLRFCQMTVCFKLTLSDKVKIIKLGLTALRDAGVARVIYTVPQGRSMM